MIERAASVVSPFYSILLVSNPVSYHFKENLKSEPPYKDVLARITLVIIIYLPASKNKGYIINFVNFYLPKKSFEFFKIPRATPGTLAKILI